MRAADDDNALALVLDLDGPKGALVAHLTTYPLGESVLAKEAVFWIDPEARGGWALSMIRAYEAWAKARGAVMAGLSCFADDRTAKLFLRAGYRQAEVNTTKEL